MLGRILATVAMIGVMSSLKGQTDTAAAEEDFSLYENFDFADGEARRFCTPKVFDLSPAKLISVGYETRGAFSVDYGNLNNLDSGWQTGSSRFSVFWFFGFLL